jgi:D-glycero-alpha-D-manno-heptose-7-phosphate kinase
MYIERAPLRISLIGGGLDFPNIINDHDICTLAFTIDKYVHAIVNPLVACFDYKFRVGYKEQDYGHFIDDIRHPVVRESLRFFQVDDYLDIQSLSNIPSIAGLGSSSAFAIALFKCLNKLTKRGLTDLEILNHCIEMERFTNNNMGGLQDQYHSFYGGFNLINYQQNEVVKMNSNLTTSILEGSALVLDHNTLVTNTSSRGVGGSWYSPEELELLISINASIKHATYANNLTFNLLLDNFEQSCKHKLSKMISAGNFHATPFTTWLIENNIFSWKYCGAPGSRAIYILSSKDKIAFIKHKIATINSLFEIPINISNS